MKFGLWLSLVLMAQMSFAETIATSKKREEMIKRVDSLSLQVKGIRTDLGKKDVVAACVKLKSVFKAYPDHILDMGAKMDLLNGKINRSVNADVTYLMTMHQDVLVCDSGTGCENVDPERLSKKMKVIEKSLASDKKLIQKKSLDHSNKFKYCYGSDEYCRES